jgi:hypothetical protein
MNENSEKALLDDVYGEDGIIEKLETLVNRFNLLADACLKLTNEVKVIAENQAIFKKALEDGCKQG